MRPKTRPENPMNNMKQVLTSFGLLAAGIGLARGNEGLKVRFEMRSQKCAARKRYVLTVLLWFDGLLPGKIEMS